MTRGARGPRRSSSRSRSPPACWESVPPHAPMSPRRACSAHAVVVVEPGPGPSRSASTVRSAGSTRLQLAGANPVTYGFAGQGAAVCQLFGVGNPADQSSCLVGPGSQYWAYYRAATRRGRLDLLARRRVDDHRRRRLGRGLAVRHRRRARVRELLRRRRLRTPADGSAPRHAGRTTRHRTTGRRAVDTAHPRVTGRRPQPSTAAGKDGGKSKAGDSSSGDRPRPTAPAPRTAQDPKGGSATTTGKAGTNTSDRRETVGQRGGGRRAATVGQRRRLAGGVIVAVPVVAARCRGRPRAAPATPRPRARLTTSGTVRRSWRRAHGPSGRATARATTPATSTPGSPRPS